MNIHAKPPRGGKKAKGGFLGTALVVVLAIIGWYLQQQQQGGASQDPGGKAIPTVTPSSPGGFGDGKPILVEKVPHSNASTIEGVCNHVVDGDTVHVKTPDGRKIIVRILGIDTMETHQPDKSKQQASRYRTSVSQIHRWGNEAKKRGESMLRNKRVVLVNPLGKLQYDPHGRLLAYVEINGVDFGETLLKAGLAEARREAQARRTYYQKLNREAQKARVGIYAGSK